VNYYTNDFHVYRAERRAQSLGITACHIGAPTVWYAIPSNYLREILAVVKSWVVTSGWFKSSSLWEAQYPTNQPVCAKIPAMSSASKR
jgi:uncharacterized SAM-binding protein YcdF (DUF218 family)